MSLNSLDIYFTMSELEPLGSRNLMFLLCFNHVRVKIVVKTAGQLVILLVLRPVFPVLFLPLNCSIDLIFGEKVRGQKIFSVERNFFL